MGLTEFRVKRDGSVAVTDGVALAPAVAAGDLGTALVRRTLALLDLAIGLADHSERIPAVQVVVVEVATLVTRD